MQHKVPSTIKKGMHLRTYLLGVFPQLTTNSAIRKAIKSAAILVNGKPATTGYWVQPNDEIHYSIQPINIAPTVAIDVVYEDDWLAVIDKPAGLTSSGNKNVTLANFLPNLLQASTEIDALINPLLVHRLDKATSGLILAAKTAKVRVQLGAMLEQGEIKKQYIAIVEGHLRGFQSICLPIDGQSAETEILDVRHLHTKDATSLVTVRLHTGRTHQIRRHFQMIEHPLVGDMVYNLGGLGFGRGLFLFSHLLEFEHPITREHTKIQLDIPKKFAKYLSYQKS